ETDAVNVKQLSDAVKASGWKLKVNTETDAEAEKVANDEAVTFEQGDNIVITRNGKTVTVATSKTPTFGTLKTTGKAEIGGELAVTGPATFADKVTANKGLDVNGATTLNGTVLVKDKLTAEKGLEVTGTTTLNNGATIKGGDLVMSNNKITGLADGVDTKDAVNVGQLDNKVNDAKTELKGDIDTAKTE
ncbi:hypothetical protein HT655_09480, partial [Ursidibacter maritimus]|nr:hypothetical protein [Ursidibacter maritimus]MBV6549370.1 hypothetical protein [Ursidibacter maritimus]